MKRLTVILILFLTYSGLIAETKSLYLSKCIDLAVQNSYRLQESKVNLQAEAVGYEIDQTRYYPYLSGGFSHDQLFFGDHNYRQLLGQVVIDWSPGNWLLKVAEIQKENIRLVKVDRQQVIIDISHKIAFLYLSILQKQISQNLLKNRLQLLVEHLQVAQALWEAGTRTQLDVLHTQAAINQLRAQMIFLETDIRTIRKQIAVLINLPEHRVDNLEDFPTAIIKSDFIPDQSFMSLAHNPILMALEIRYQIQQLQLRKVKASKLPQFKLSSGYYADPDPIAEGNYWYLGVGLQFPIFQWGLTNLQKQKIKAKTEAIHFKHQHLSQELQIRLDQIYENLSALQAVYQLQKSRLHASVEMQQLATVNYQAGLITNLEYLAAQNNLLENQLALHQTRLSYVLKIVDIYTLTNQPEKIAQLQGAKNEK